MGDKIFLDPPGVDSCNPTDVNWWIREWINCNNTRYKYKMALLNIQNILQDNIENTMPFQLTIDIEKIVKEALK